MTEEKRAALAAQLAKARAAKAAKKAAEEADPVMAAAKKNASLEPSATDGPDIGRIQELVGQYPQVSLEIKRLSNMQWSNVEDNMLVPPSTLFKFGELIEPICGGGRFAVRVRDPDNLGEILTKFNYRLDRPPRPRAVAGMPAASPWALPLPLPGMPPMPPMPMMPDPTFVAQPEPAALPTTQTPSPTPTDPAMQTPPYPPPNMPPQYRAYPVDQQWALYNILQQQMQQRPGGVYSADQIAMQNVQQLLAEKGKLEAERASLQAQFMAMQKATEEKIAVMQKDLERQRDEERKRADRAEAEARDARLRADAETRENALKAQIARLETLITTAQKPVESNSLKEYVPIITAWLGQQAAKGEAELKRSMDMMKIILESTKKEPNPAEAALTKGMIDMMRLRNEEKAAGTEAQVMMLGALSNFIKEQQGPSPPWWLPMVESVVQSVQAGVATAVVASTQGPPPPAPAPEPPRLQGTTPPQQQQPQPTIETQGAPVAPPAIRQMSPAEQLQWQGFMQTNELAAKATFAAYQSPQMPDDLRTHEWRVLIFNLHLKEDPEDLAPIVVDHLEHLNTFGLLPEAFQMVFSEPEKAFGFVLNALPIGQMDPAYTSAFLDTIVKEIKDRETERARVAREDAEEQEQAAAPTPAS